MILMPKKVRETKNNKTGEPLPLFTELKGNEDSKGVWTCHQSAFHLAPLPADTLSYFNTYLLTDGRKEENQYCCAPVY